MKKRLAALLMLAVMLVSCMSFVPSSLGTAVASDATLVDTSVKFVDVKPGTWYKAGVDYVVTHGLFSGMSENMFEPDTAMTRAMFVSVLARMDGDKTFNTIATKFIDVPSGRWYTGAVKWASDNGVVFGVTENSFDPTASITREQMCAIIIRYVTFKGFDLLEKNAQKSFDDGSMISGWAQNGVYACQRAGIISGLSERVFGPKFTATRAQVARILSVLHDDYHEIIDIINNSNGAVSGGGILTSSNGFVFDDDKALETSERLATEISIYNFDQNPLINRERQVNRNIMPSFDIDKSGFVRDGTSVKDLKGKTLQFFTADIYAMWAYRDSKGQTISEWEWFKLLKSEIGLNVKYTVKQGQNSIKAAIQNMTAGKQCDVIYANDSIMLQSLAVSKSITSLVNINNLGSAPGVCKTTMDAFKWGNSLRVISPIGNVDVLWYNQTLTQQLGLSDPHTMWEAGVWDWSGFKNYMYSVPLLNRQGKQLVAYTDRLDTLAECWSATNGAPVVDIAANTKVPTVVSNWNNPQAQIALDFISGINRNIKFKNSGEDKATGVCPEYMGLYEGTTLMTGTMYSQVYHDTEYSKYIQINWVPYPKANTKTGVEIARSRGIGMLLPAKTVKPGNQGVALKFMELWATRFTETIFDNLNTFEYYIFNYKMRKQYFNFVTQNTCASVGIDYTNILKVYKCLAGAQDTAVKVYIDEKNASILSDILSNMVNHTAIQ